MANYDFSTLSPFDFEILCRDLFSKDMNQRFESFAPGRDGGIDLRCFITESKQIIVQCKHYKTFKSLKSTLKNEKAKIELLNPTRYILATTVDLTPGNKDEIISILTPYLTSPKDIYGRSDINQLLTDFPAVERDHFKLWLSSTNVLLRILNNGAYTMSEFVQSEINDRIKYYVQNQSFNQALEIINKQRVVVISGVKGIGKTTLAHLLIYNLLQQKAAQFFVISDSISEGFNLFDENENQIFFFDDFLGRNFIEVALGINEDDKLIKFIGRIQRSKNKILICTTREFILRQASNKYEKLSDSKIEFSKLVLDISHYTQFTKAEILYNHLYFANLNRNFIEKFVSKKMYMTIITHRNYNPRLIDFITLKLKKEKVWKNEIKDFIIGQLDNPEEIWKHDFETGISKISQNLLLVMLTCGDPIFYEDLFQALTSFLEASSITNLNFDEIEYKKCIKELENSFISTSMDTNGKFIINFNNPGIVDFIIKYIGGLKPTQKVIIESARFINQLSSIFDYPSDLDDPLAFAFKFKPITLDKDQFTIIQRKITVEYDNLRFSSLSKVYNSNGQPYYKYKIDSEVDKLIELLKIIEFTTVNNDLKNFIKGRAELFTDNYCENMIPSTRIMQLLELCFNVGITLDKNLELFILLFSELSSIEEISHFTKMEALVKETFHLNFLDESKIKDILMDIILSEIDSIEYEEWEDKRETLEEINGNFGIDVSDIIRSVESKFDHEVDFDEDSVYENWKDTRDMNSEDNSIHDLYNSLLT